MAEFGEASFLPSRNLREATMKGGLECLHGHLMQHYTCSFCDELRELEQKVQAVHCPHGCLRFQCQICRKKIT